MYVHKSWKEFNEEDLRRLSTLYPDAPEAHFNRVNPEYSCVLCSRENCENRNNYKGACINQIPMTAKEWETLQEERRQRNEDNIRAMKEHFDNMSDEEIFGRLDEIRNRNCKMWVGKFREQLSKYKDLLETIPDEEIYLALIECMADEEDDCDPFACNVYPQED